jgi:hypothetical protein
MAKLASVCRRDQNHPRMPPRVRTYERLSSADRLLLVVGVLFFADCFARWQSICCPRPNAWGGSGAFLGGLAGLSAVALAAWIVLPLARVRTRDGDRGRPLPVGTALATAVLSFGSLKLVVVLFHHPAMGAFAGLVLLVLAAYGAYMKLEERRAGGPMPRRGR